MSKIHARYETIIISTSYSFSLGLFEENLPSFGRYSTSWAEGIILSRKFKNIPNCLKYPSSCLPPLLSRLDSVLSMLILEILSFYPLRNLYKNLFLSKNYWIGLINCYQPKRSPNQKA